MSGYISRSETGTFLLMTAIAFIAAFAAIVCISDDSNAAVGDQFDEGGIRYQITSDTKVTVTPLSSGKYTGDIVIPASVTHDSAEYSVTAIKQYAFRSCSGLKTVSIPNTVITIGDYAFYNCGSLKSVTIPKNVASIGINPFSTCSNLTEIDVDPENTAYSDDNGVLFDFGKTKLISYPIGKKDAAYTLPASVRTIGGDAFYSSKLTSMPALDNVTTLEDYAFFDCDSFTSVTIPRSVASIGINPFASCSSLTTIVVDPENVNYCADESSVLYDIGKTRLICYPIGRTDTSYSIPDSVRTIGDDSFYGAKLSSVSIPNGVTSINYDAFASCRNLESISIPDSVTSIGSEAFYSCTKLTSFSVPNSVTAIGDYALSNCTSLISVFVHADAVPSIGSHTFSGSSITLICVPYQKYNDYIAADNWKEQSSKIMPAVEIPVVQKNLKYSGSEQTAVTASEGVYTVSGNTGTDADTYCAAVTLVTATPARCWFDGTQDALNLEWSIAKRSVVMTSASDSKVYDGKPLTNGTVTVTGDGFVAGQGATYSVIGTQTDVGSSDNGFTYELTGASEDNYDIDLVYGKLTVTAATPVITIGKSSSCPSGDYNISASTTSGADLAYSLQTGSDIISIDQNGKVTAKTVGTATITVSCDSTGNYTASSKEFTITVYDHIHVIVPGVAPTKTQSGQTEGEECSECHKVFKHPTSIPATGSDKTTIGSENSGVKYAVPKSDELKELKVTLNGSKYTIDLNQSSTEKVKDTVIEFSITAVEKKADTYSAVMKSDDKEFSGEMNVTLPYDPSKGTPSVRWIEGNEQMSIVSVNANEKTVTFMTTHNSTYAVEYEDKVLQGTIICIVLIASFAVLALLSCFMYPRRRE